MAKNPVTIACMSIKLLKSCWHSKTVAATGRHLSYDARMHGSACRPKKGAGSQPVAAPHCSWGIGMAAPSGWADRYCHNGSGFINNLLAVMSGQV